MAFPATAALVADQLGSVDAAAYDLSAGCTGFMYAIAQAHAIVAAGLAQRALVIGGDVLSRVLDWTDRSTLVLFGDGAGAVVLEHVDEGGFLGFELGADGSGGDELNFPGSGSRLVDDGTDGHLRMNGREVFKFATRVLVSSARGAPRGMRAHRRRRRRVRPPPGERPHHRPRCQQTRLPQGEGGGQRRPIRQHLVGLDPARAGRRVRERPPEARKPRPDDRNGRRPHLGLGADALDSPTNGASA